MSVAANNELAGAGIVDTRLSPHCAVRSVPLAAVRWRPGFWAERFEQCQQVTLPHLERLMDDPGQGHALTNLRIAAGLEEGDFAGTQWQDEWVYKWLEAAAYIYEVTGDATLDRRMDEIIAIIATAQERDGYIATQITVRGLPRWQQIGHHELYVMGHLITAGSIHHRVTGKANLLDVARKVADYLHATFMPPRPRELAHFCFNPSQIMALVELYRTVGDRRYLNLANEFIDMRGSEPPQGDGKLGGTDQTQDRVSLRSEREVVGHMVTATYLYAGAADVFLEAGDRTLLEALQRLWQDLTERKMYVTGGVGPLHHGLSIRGDRVSEAMDRAYRLPSSTAYNETCAQIGLFMWNWRLLGITGDAQYAETMELALYNSILSGIGLDGASWFYTNVLRWYSDAHPLLHNDAHVRFQPGDPARGRHHICCPTNLLRLVAGLHNYCYGLSAGALWVHLYGANSFTGTIPGGPYIRLTQETAYPWDENVRFVLDAIDPQDEPRFSLHLRIPAWARGARCTVNGEPLPVQWEPGTYATIARAWRVGDMVELSLPMEVRLIESHPRVEETRNQVAIARGPIVYCLEDLDLPAGVPLSAVRIPRDISLTCRRSPGALGGLVLLEGVAVMRGDPEQSGALYRDMTTTEPQPIPVTLLPTFAWNNRGEASMSIWLPID